MIIDDGFLSEFYSARTLYVGGRKGAGKTLIAYEVAEPLLRRGWRLVSNVVSVWADPLLPYERRVVFHVDEGGIYLRRFSTVQVLFNFLRKTDSYLIVSGRKAPHVDLQELCLYPLFDFWFNFLIPLRLWRWEVVNPGSKSYHGYVAQVNWRRYYGVYDTLDPGENPAVICDLAEDQARALFARYGRTYRLGDVRSSGDDLSGLGEAVSEFGSEARQLSQTLRESRRKRFSLK